MMREARTRWRLAGEEPPEGWRRGGQWLLDDGTLEVLYTNAPEDESPFWYCYKYIKYVPVLQERVWVEWEDVT
jgi:hypothetical protein